MHVVSEIYPEWKLAIFFSTFTLTLILSCASLSQSGGVDRSLLPTRACPPICTRMLARVLTHRQPPVRCCFSFRLTRTQYWFSRFVTNYLTSKPSTKGVNLRCRMKAWVKRMGPSSPCKNTLSESLHSSVPKQQGLGLPHYRP